MQINELQAAAIYYKENILPFVYVFTLYDNRKIIVYPEERHFKHLTGIQYINNIDIDDEVIVNDTVRFYKACLKGNFDKDYFLSEEYKNVTLEEKKKLFKKEYFYDMKVTHFSEILSVIENQYDLISFNAVKYQLQTGNQQDADFFRFEIEEQIGKYVGIKRDGNVKEAIYFCISSIVHEEDNPDKYFKGQNIFKLNNYEKIRKKEFHIQRKQYMAMNYLTLPSQTEIKKIKNRIKYYIYDEIKELCGIYELNNVYKIDIIQNENKLILCDGKNIIGELYLCIYEHLKVDEFVQEIVEKIKELIVCHELKAYLTAVSNVSLSKYMDGKYILNIFIEEEDSYLKITESDIRNSGGLTSTIKELVES